MTTSSMTVGPARAEGPSIFQRIKNLVLETDEDPAAMLARLVLAVVIFPHGAQHALGWFGGYGFAGTLGWMTGTLGIPAPLAAFSIVFELAVPFLLAVGVGGRIAGLGLALHMLVAASTHAGNGFFMNWVGRQAGEGFEYHVLAIALALTLVIRGSGSWSIDRRLAASAKMRA